MISKEFEISHSTVQKTVCVQDIQNNSQHAQVWLSKQVHPESRQQDAKEVTKNPKMCSRDLQLALATVDVKVPLQPEGDYTSLIFMGGNIAL